MTKIAATMNTEKEKYLVKYTGQDSIRCGICFKKFHIKKRLPKLLPCEHNFCEQCILSLCCHQQYYLLDSINCPTCRTELSTSTALGANTNYALCQLIEAIQSQQAGNTNDADITVIHIPDKKFISGNKLLKVNSWRSSSRTFSSSKRCQLMQCTDCCRKMNEKKCRKEARFCTNCFNTKKDDDDCLRVLCLECCVNRHNGHKLLTLNELEREHQKLIKDLRTLRRNIQETNRWIEANLKMLSEESQMPATDCVVLCKAKKNLGDECEADMKFALSILENGDTTPLPPMVLQRMRQHQYHNRARLHKLLHFIEKCNRSIKECCNQSIKMDTSTSHWSLFSSARQTRITLCNNASDDRSTAEAIAAVLKVGFDCKSEIDENGNRMTIMQGAMQVLTRKSSTKSLRRAALLCCAKQLRESMDENIDKKSILLYIDAYLHIFYQLNLLVTRIPSDDDSQDKTAVTRYDIWKLIQVVYSDLMRYAAKHWKSDESERVDLVDDLAFLCFLYWDVSDEATITICMIEAARARVSAVTTISTTNVNNNCEKSNEVEDDDERLTINIRLNLIDEHLLECRRLQKLQRLRATVVTKSQKYNCQQSLKELWKLLSMCFNKFSKHQ